jgi:Aldo/keto reductase family
MTERTDLAGSFTLPGTSLTVNRMGYGAMQLAGPHVFGPPRDNDEAIAVLREAVESGVNHIDTSDYYGPHVTNQIIRQPADNNSTECEYGQSGNRQWQAEHSNNDEKEEHSDECCCQTEDSTRHVTCLHQFPRLSGCCSDCESLLSVHRRGGNVHQAIHDISARTARWWFTVVPCLVAT